MEFHDKILFYFTVCMHSLKTISFRLEEKYKILPLINITLY